MEFAKNAARDLLYTLPVRAGEFLGIHRKFPLLIFERVGGAELFVRYEMILFIYLQTFLICNEIVFCC